jgi:NOL1/NOP2/fmu family ribosome biogenesis protein
MQVKKMSEEEVEGLKRIIEKNYGCNIDFSSYDFYVTKRNEVFIAIKNLEEELIKKASYFGFYFGKLKRNEKIQLSVEGSQIVGKIASKNIAILNDENISRFMESLECKWENLINCETNNFVLIKHGEDFFGCGILRENKIESLIPKARRIMKTLRKV